MAQNNENSNLSKVPRASSAEQIQHAPSSDRSLPGEKNDEKSYKDKFVPGQEKTVAPKGDVRSDP